MVESWVTVSVVSRLAAVRLVVHPDLRQGVVQSTSERVADVVLTSWRGLVELHERALTQIQKFQNYHPNTGSATAAECWYVWVRLVLRLQKWRANSHKDDSFRMKRNLDCSGSLMQDNDNVPLALCTDPRNPAESRRRGRVLNVQDPIVFSAISTKKWGLKAIHSKTFCWQRSS